MMDNSASIFFEFGEHRVQVCIVDSSSDGRPEVAVNEIGVCGSSLDNCLVWIGAKRVHDPSGLVVMASLAPLICFFLVFDNTCQNQAGVDSWVVTEFYVRVGAVTEHDHLLSILFRVSNVVLFQNKRNNLSIWLTGNNFITDKTFSVSFLQTWFDGGNDHAVTWSSESVLVRECVFICNDPFCAFLYVKTSQSYLTIIDGHIQACDDGFYLGVSFVGSQGLILDVTFWVVMLWISELTTDSLKAIASDFFSESLHSNVSYLFTVWQILLDPLGGNSTWGVQSVKFGTFVLVMLRLHLFEHWCTRNHGGIGDEENLFALRFQPLNISKSSPNHLCFPGPQDTITIEKEVIVLFR